MAGPFLPGPLRAGGQCLTSSSASIGSAAIALIVAITSPSFKNCTGGGGPK